MAGKTNLFSERRRATLSPATQYHIPYLVRPHYTRDLERKLRFKLTKPGEVAYFNLKTITIVRNHNIWGTIYRVRRLLVTIKKLTSDNERNWARRLECSANKIVTDVVDEIRYRGIKLVNRQFFFLGPAPSTKLLIGFV